MVSISLLLPPPPPPHDRRVLVHYRVTSQEYVASTHLYTWGEERQSGVKKKSSLSKEKETTRWATLEPQTSRSRVSVERNYFRCLFISS